MSICYCYIFPDITPTVSGPFQSSASIPAPTAGGLAIGIPMAIAVVTVLMMLDVSSLIAYFFVCKKKGSPLNMDSKVFFVYVHLCMPSSLSACNFAFMGLYIGMCVIVSSLLCINVCTRVTLVISVVFIPKD